MSNYRRNKELAKTRNTEPTMTDQANATETDINVIVGRFMKTGMAPGAAAEPQYDDYSNLPTDLRGFIELAASLNENRARLPEKLRDMPIDELTALTAKQLADILTPAPTPAPEGETK